MTTDAGRQADEFIAAEVARQERMWEPGGQPRVDATKGQLLDACFCSLALVQQGRDPYYIEEASPEERAEIAELLQQSYPEGWSGFRDYGSDVANLAVAAAYIRAEMRRLIASGADTARTSRDYVAQPYTGPDQPAVRT